MRCTHTFPIAWAASAVWAGLALTALAASSPPSAQILKPVEGAAVTRFQEVRGRMVATQGWPVVAVRPLLAGEPYWIQPPVQRLADDGTFTSNVFAGNATTPDGTRFHIVVLVAPSRAEAQRRFPRGLNLRTLPADVPKSAPITVVRGGRARPRDRSRAPRARSITFAGHSWTVKTGQGVGPGPNDFADTSDNVRLDGTGQLHLALTQRDGRPVCAEVVGPALGYGVYEWVVSGDLAGLDPNTVLGLFIYRADQSEEEIDFLEVSRFGEKANADCQFVVQPHAPDSMHRFRSGGARVLTCRCLWQPGLVHARCWAGEDTSRTPLADWRYTGPKIPRPGGQGLRVRANLWAFHGRAPATTRRQEVVIRSFRFVGVGQVGQGADAVATIIAPRPDDRVARVSEVRGRLLCKKGSWPVVLVRPVADDLDEPWYVQGAVMSVDGSGQFRASAYFGNARTPSGTPFRIVILGVPSRDQARRDYPRGKTIRTLPPGLPVSQPVTVNRR